MLGGIAARARDMCDDGHGLVTTEGTHDEQAMPEGIAV